MGRVSVSSFVIWEPVMPDPLGLSFLPPDPSARYGPGGGGAPGASPIQQAIQLLALHLPRVMGATSPIPTPLLQSLGGGGLMGGGGEGLQEVLRRLMAPWLAGQMGLAAPGAAPWAGGAPGPLPSPPGLPAPRVTPGFAGPSPRPVPAPMPTPGPGRMPMPAPPWLPGGSRFRERTPYTAPAPEMAGPGRWPSPIAGPRSNPGNLF